MSKTRVLLADDHRIVIEGLKKLLEPEYDVVGTVEDGRALIAAVAELQPDVVVADISMPHLNGIEAVRQIKQKNPNIKVVMLTMHHDVQYAVRAFEAGASGFVLKVSAPNELITAIGEARKGKTYVTPGIAGELIQSYREGKENPEVGFSRLSARQQEILQLVAEGHSAKEIGKILSISARTVESHKYQIMELLNLKTTAELVQFAIKHGIISI
ncbi:MAG TPA: response regulator transcription factor [Thermodesulfobacteriota bacterium]|nr:response regulator transcription factor [Thermodesulfobacteriota bacterium]